MISPDTMNRYEGKCDICTKPDGSREHNLQKCRECGVLVHELCYGMVPTTTKNPDFVCHACKAIAKDRGGIEVNVPSKVGGWVLKDVLGKEEGIASFREFLRGADGEEGVAVRKLDFCIAVNKYKSSKIEKDETELWGDSLKTRAQHLFDTYCAINAERKVELPPNVLDEAESKIFNGDEKSITTSLFDAARQIILKSLEDTRLAKYKKSSTYKSYLTSQRTFMEQKERPTECVLCSVKNGMHAMHPLYDFDGKEGRQLCLPASGVGFMRREKRLAWVHTLCAMFICSSAITGSLVYGCDEDGKWEEDDDDDEEEENIARSKVIDSEDEDEDGDPSRDLEKEQHAFTKCEEVFQPLMKRLQDSNDGSKDVDDVLLCIGTMVDNIELLTPSFIQEYQIGRLVKEVRGSFEGTHAEVKVRCKRLSKEMRRVYKEKEGHVPAGFKPVKNLKETKEKNKVQNSIFDGKKDEDGSSEILDTDANDVIEQKYKIGTAISKAFYDGTHAGKIEKYYPESNLYHIVYDNGDSEDLEESEVSHLILSYTAWFCISGPVNGRETAASKRIKEYQQFTCVICKKKDNANNKCLRIPVQCSAGDPSEFHEFKQHHKELNKQKKLAKRRGEEHRGCAEPMHVGCARWMSNYARVKNKKLRMCYYFPGKPPTYTGEDAFHQPVSNCFCRKHSIEVQEGITKSLASSGGGGGDGEAKDPDVMSTDKRKGHGASSGQDESEEETAEQARRLRIAIARKKKRRIMEGSDEESE